MKTYLGKTNYIIAVLLTCSVILMEACSNISVQQAITGTVIDATMNNIMLINSDGNTINISTMDADPAKIQEVLIGDSVSITYIKEKIGETEIITATKLTIILHSPYYYIAGKWTEPNPINPQEVQGMVLEKNGTASSVGMATLIFESWKLDGKNLLLRSKSIGNHEPLEGTDTLQIVKLDIDSLILASQAGERIWNLNREK